jgi:hypothetical protein
MFYDFIQNLNQPIVAFIGAGQNQGDYGLSIIFLSNSKRIIKIISIILSLILIILGFAS